MCSVYLGTVAPEVLKHETIMRAQGNKMSEMGAPAVALLV